MITEYTYFKNSNTGELIMTQEFKDTVVEFPIYFYNHKKESIDRKDLSGFVEIAERKFERERRKMLRS